MTNKQTIEAPRELLERIMHGCMFSLSSQQHEELRALIDKPAAESKPFAWYRVPKGFPLQGAFYPYIEGRSESDIQNSLDAECGFYVKRLYAEPAAQPQGEVERLRDAVDHYCKLSNAVIEERDTLRAQLAERDALLRMASELLQTISLHTTTSPSQWCSHFQREVKDRIQKIDAALSTSAEPKPRGEPSHWADSEGNTITAELKAYNLKIGGAPSAASECYRTPLYAWQPAPSHSGDANEMVAKVVLPERRVIDEGASDADQNSDYGYNAALNDVAKLNGLKS